MKSLKKITAALAVVTVLFMSCEQKEKDIFDDGSIVLNLENGKQAKVKKDYYGTYSFSNWNSFNVANIELYQLENIDYKTSTARLENLNNTISILPNSMPNWLRTEAILEDINGVQEEYQNLLNEKDESTRNVKENWEELTKKFDDLREEIDETIKDYIS